jgi:hypothetical protein
MDSLFVETYVEKLKKLAAESEKESSKSKSEYAEIVGEITNFLNEERAGGPYPPLEPKRVGMLVSYIWTKGGAGDLRKFRDDVRSKGAWFFWWIVKPKRDPGANIK